MRVIVVSNRLPITIKKTKEGYEYTHSVGGVSNGLRLYLESQKERFDYIWVGWSGESIDKRDRGKVKNELKSDYNCYPVFLSQKDIDDFYGGFCNKTIWPLFHYFTGRVVFDDEYYEAYVRANQIYLEAILEILEPDDLVWVHDYQLMLLPKMIKDSNESALIAFFLHIPFPDYEIYRILPRECERGLLDGVVGADVIGFHTDFYKQYFLRCVLRELGHEYKNGYIETKGKTSKVDTYPIGIDYEKVRELAHSKKAQEKVKEFKEKFKTQKIILSVDRLDYTKGIINRLLGYERFLEKNPEYLEKVVLLLIAVPSRSSVESYQALKRQLDELVGKINGRFSRFGYAPILYLYQSFSFEEIVGIYRASDIALITPIRDGMNLIAKEFVASKDDRGVLILSETAGAVKELGEAISINPNAISEISDAILEALTMDDREQARRLALMQKRLARYTIETWGNEMIKALVEQKEKSMAIAAKKITPPITAQIKDSYLGAKKRLLFLDYDGTLVPFAAHPTLAKPDSELIELLSELKNLQNTKVVIISGRNKETLEEWLGTLGLDMVAEHGSFVKESGHEWGTPVFQDTSWKEMIMGILSGYEDRLPNSFIEEKSFSLAWHYRRSDPELAINIAKELYDELSLACANSDITALFGNKVIEVKNAGINKGTGGLYFANKERFDFMLSIGDDKTDEDLFMALPESANTIKVGLDNTNAKYFVPTHKEVRIFLRELAK